MKWILTLVAVTSLVLVTGCSQTPPSPTQLARKYWQCRVLKTLRGKECLQYQPFFDEVTDVLQDASARQNLGQTIMNTQTQLVTLEQEHAKKEINDAKRAELAQSIQEQQRKVRVLHSAFLVMSARQQ